MQKVALTAASTVLVAGLACSAGAQLCDPAASFDSPIVFEGFFAATSLAMQDLDGDGNPDAVIADEFADAVQVLLGDGVGSFGSGTAFPVGEDPFIVKLGDVNGDGQLDAVVTNRASGDLSVLLGAGDGSFGEQSRFPAGVEPLALQLADVDSDGDLDAIVIDRGESGFDVLRNEGSGSFGMPSRVVTSDVLVFVEFADLDADGDLDAVGRVGRGQPVVLVNSGGGVFEPERELVTPIRIESLKLADMDGDGDVDIVGLEQLEPITDTSMALVFANEGDLNFTAGTLVNVPILGAQVELVDLDGDLDLDVVTADSLNDSVALLFNNGDGTLDPGGRYGAIFAERPTSGGIVGVATGDTDGDGDADIVVARNRESLGGVLLNRGDGTFAAPVRARVDSTEGETSSEIAITDFDRDGRLDIVSVSEGANGPFFLYGAGLDTFVAGEPTDTSRIEPSDVALGDFNADGLPDVVVAGERIAALLNRGDRTFAVNEDDFELDSGDGQVAVGDMDGDGFEDIVTTESSVVTRFGDGTGGFPRLQELQIGVSTPTDLLLLDADRDGSLDVLLLDWGFRILYNDGVGGLGDPVRLADIDRPARFEVADLDADGRADVVIASPGLLSIFLATADGSFALSDEIAVDPIRFPFVAVGLGDIDGDGSIDIVAPQGEGITTVLLNDGGASFDVPFTIMDDGLETTSIATADMDGNGSVDVVKLDRGPSAFFNEVTVLPNRCRPAECPADLDRDGRLTLFDFLAFQNAFDAGDPVADFDGDGELTLFDFLAFQNAFDAGCA